MKRTLTTLTIGAALLAGCGSSDGTEAAEATTAPATPAATTEPDPEPTTPEAPKVRALGDEINLSVIKASVIEYRKGVEPARTADPGARWDAVKVKVCNTGLEADLAPLVFNWGVWQLDDGDGGRFDASNVRYRQFPAPEFADDEAIPVGDCSKGWVVFDVPDDIKVSQANLVVEDERQASWSLQ